MKKSILNQVILRRLVSITKTIITLFLLLITLSIISCSKDDEPEEELSQAYEFSNITSTPLIDLNVTDIPIEVSATGTIIDKNKVTLEFYLEHSFQRDLELSLITPDGEEQSFVYRIGGGSDYIEANLLRFNSTFTDELSNTNINIPAGNYKESKGGEFNSIILEPIFSFLEGKNINGTWKLRVRDHFGGDIGNLISCRLLFAEGALEQ